MDKQKNHSKAEKSASLLDILAEELHCEYLSDLKYLNTAGKMQLVDLLANIPAERYSLHDWIDALNYFVHKSEQQQTAQTVRDLLLAALSAELT